MNKFYTLLFAFMVISFSLKIEALSQAEESQLATKNKDTIIWLVEDKKENINLVDNDSPSNSAASAVERYVIFQLEQYNIELKRVSIKRIDHYLQTNRNICVSNRAKLESRQLYSAYSHPQSFYLTHKLYRFNKSFPLPPSLFNENNELNAIKDIFHLTPSETIGMAEGVSFGKFLDKEVAKLDENNIYYRGGTQRVIALESMLYAGRVDYLLALPVDINPTTEQESLLEQYTIAGTSPFIIAHFTCSKSDLGKKVIQDINRILVNSYNDQTFYHINKKWYLDDNFMQIQNYLKTHFPAK